MAGHASSQQIAEIPQNQAVLSENRLPGQLVIN